MKNTIAQVVYTPEGKDQGTVNPTQTNDQVANVLAQDEVPLTMEDRNLDYVEVQNNLVQQLKEYAENAGVNGYVIGVSGGVDSGVTSTLCAMSGMELLVVEMPIHQASAEVDRAQEHIQWLIDTFPNVKKVHNNLTETFETFKNTFPDVDDEVARYLAHVNTRARLRAVTLYAHATEHKLLVAGTGNRVEDYGIGFFTKYGDGAVDVSPIGELYKSEVYNLGRQIGVANSILEARPTDGLHTNGATDEDQIGCKYDELEWAMVEYDEGKRTEDFTGRKKEVMEIYSKRHEANAHKMEMPPVFSLQK